ncbi:glycosyltransferase [Marinobacterium sp. xm-d-509]|uniref:glycosyltransferase n=1 Tax=unclassified Marinobacterium TaxID=2644139 RepID=UPI00352EA87B
MQFIGSKKLGGAENFFIRLTNSLSSLSDCSALIAKGSEIKHHLNCSYSESLILGPSDPLSKFNVKQKLVSESPQIVQSWMGRATRLVPKKRSFVHIARLGGYYDVSHYRSADYLVGNTQGICDYLVKEGVSSKKVHHISNFVKPVELDKAAARLSVRNELGLHQDTQIIFSLGRLHPNKGFDCLLRAFSKTLTTARSNNAKLIIAGDGPLKTELSVLAEELSIANDVIWLGWRQDVPDLMAASDLFICPSRFEPLGNVILEAWSQKLPVITSMTSGALELAEDGSSAIFFPIDDDTVLSESIRDWLISPSGKYGDLSLNGYSELLNKFSESAITDSYMELYKKASN